VGLSFDKGGHGSTSVVHVSLPVQATPLGTAAALHSPVARQAPPGATGQRVFVPSFSHAAATAASADSLLLALHAGNTSAPTIARAVVARVLTGAERSPARGPRARGRLLADVACARSGCASRADLLYRRVTSRQERRYVLVERPVRSAPSGSAAAAARIRGIAICPSRIWYRPASPLARVASCSAYLARTALRERRARRTSVGAPRK
jgi:hypothetical protein